jgi:peroxiredoxin
MDTMISTGLPAPDFSLPDLDGQLHTLSSARGRVAVVNFWSAECPLSERADREVLVYLEGWGQAVRYFTIAANTNEPTELIRQVSQERGLSLVLRDHDQRIADAYGAQTTPHFFVVDRIGVLRYQGALDDVTFRQRTATRFYLKQAVEALLAGRKPDMDQTPAYGCTIVRFI